MLGYYSFLSLEDDGCKISGLLTPSKDIYIFFCRSRLETGEFEGKVKKEVSGWAKTGKHGYFCVTPTGLHGDLLRVLLFFSTYRRHVSDVIPSLLTNSAGLKGKELQMFQHW